MPTAQHDWDHWYQVYLEFQKKAGKTKLAPFCRNNNLPYDNARKAFKAREKAEKGKFVSPQIGEPKTGKCNRKGTRHDWAKLHADWLIGEYDSLSQFARLNGINHKSGHFQQKTKNWVSEKREIQAKAEAKTLGGIENLTVAKVEAAILAQLETIMQLLNDACALGENIKKKVKYPLDWKFFVVTTQEIIKAQKQYLPWYLKIVNKKETFDILEKVKVGEISVIEASFRFEILGVSLPKTLEIELRRAEETTADDSEDLLTDEQLEILYQEMLAETEAQRTEFLPKRGKEIEKLKQEHSSSENWIDSTERPGHGS